MQRLTWELSYCFSLSFYNSLTIISKLERTNSPPPHTHRQSESYGDSHVKCSVIKDQIINEIDWLFNPLEERLESHLHWAFSPVDDHLMKIDHYWHATLVDKESGWVGELVF